MTTPDESTPEDQQDSTRTEVSETDGPVTGADAVPDKTADTPAKGAEFDDEEGSGAASDPRGDESIRDQR